MLKPTARSTQPQSSNGARTLYLGARSQKHIGCTEEALVVRNAEQQTLRYPLARVSRIVSSPQNDWSGAALELCMRHGVSITWLNARGDALGSCRPHTASTPRAAVALEAMLETPEGYERYLAWQRQRRMNILERWAETQGTRITPWQWETTKRTWVYGGNIPSVHLPAQFRGLCHAYCVYMLGQHRLSEAWWGPKAEPILLDVALTSLLWGEINLCTSAVAHSAHAYAEQTTLFERWLAANGAGVTAHIRSLERCALKALRED